MLLADERHDFIRTFYADLASVDFAKLVEVHDEMVADAEGGLRHAQGRRTAGAARPALRRARSSRCRCRSTLAQLKKGDRRGIRTAFDKLYEHRYAHHSPDEPVEMVNIRLAVDRQAAEAEISRAQARRHGDAGAPPPGLSRRCRQAGRLPGLCTRDPLGAGVALRRAGADPGARHHDRAVQGRRLQRRAIGRTDHHGGRRR